ncbi:MAG: TolC family protein [Elusimicrobiota bacterium]
MKPYKSFLIYLSYTLFIFSQLLSASDSKDASIHPISIEEFTKKALQNSRRFESAVDSLESSRYGLLETTRGLTWPTLSASAETNKSFSDNDLGSETTTKSNEGSLSLTQPVLTGTLLSLSSTWSQSDADTEYLNDTTHSKTRLKPSWTASIKQPLYIFNRNNSLRTRKQALIQWASNRSNYQAESLGIEFDARVTYYNLLLLQESSAVEKRKLESAKLVYKVTKALVNAGKLAEVESTRADLRMNRDLRRIQNSDYNLEKAFNEARDFIRLPINSKIILTSKLTYIPFTWDENELIKIALENNPQLLNSKRNLELSEINLAQTKESNKLKLTASGSYSKTRNRSDLNAPLDPYSWTLGLGATWPLFDATQTKLNVKQSQLSLKNTHRSYEKQESQLKIDIKNSVLEIKRTETQIKEFAEQKKNAEQNVEAMRLQYRNGLTRLTDVFDAENEMRDLDLEYLNLLVNYNRSKDNLKVLVGLDFEQVNFGNKK